MYTRRWSCLNLWHEFIAEYPLEADTRETWFEWDQIAPFDRDAVLDGLRKWKASDDWSYMRFVPNAVNFLKREMWKQTPRSMLTEKTKVYDPSAPVKTLTQKELFERRHIRSEGSYHMWKRAQDPKNYVYQRRGG